MLRKIILPNQLDVWAPSAVEAAVVYREVVTESTYLSHGVSLSDGAVVFDVGANVGLFAVHLARAISGARVHAFEPIPQLFDALRRNAAAHAPSVRTHNVGLADRAGEATFEIDRFMTISATMHPTIFERERGASVGDWAEAAIADAAKVDASAVLRALSAGLRSRVWRPLVLAALAPVALVLAARRRLFLQRPRCRLITLSDALAASGESHIDLLKIDVEGAEEQVLAGIADGDWPKIRQLVIEVHDVDGRLARMRELLRARGYRVVSAREDWELHALMRISTLYAVREAA